MNGLSLYLDLDQVVKQEQYKDLLREAEHYRLIKAVAQPRPKYSQRVAAALRKAMDGLMWRVPSPRPTNRAQI
jgi:hypothetical protein